MTSARLLLVDDNLDNLEVLTVLLSDKYRVSSCSSAAEALTVLEASGADLLVLDIGMTPVDGLECLQAIRSMPGFSSTPAIALTAFARRVEREAFLAAGFQAVVTKPILDHRQLEMVIDSLLESTGSSALRDDSRNANSLRTDSMVSGRPALTRQVDDGMISGRGCSTS